MQTTVFDSLIIGGGPAGLSAALYLSRFNRSVLILDSKASARWNTREINHNYFGFPEGIATRTLRARGLEQAKRFGAEYLLAEVTSLCIENDHFEALLDDSTQVTGRTVIIATGVQDHFPEFENWRDYLGSSLFWCITCDGFETAGKSLAVIGNSDVAACTALQFLQFTNTVVLVTNRPQFQTRISESWRQKLHTYAVPLKEGVVTAVRGSEGQIESITLDSGELLEIDQIFNQKQATPQSRLAVSLGVHVDEAGYILTDSEQRTNIPMVYAAGDVTKPFSHQIVTAAHEGSMAAQAANYDLYPPEWRED